MRTRWSIADSQRASGRARRASPRPPMLFDRDTRRQLMMLYAWCRHCDDVIDGQDPGPSCAGAGRAGTRRPAAVPAARDGAWYARAMPATIPAFAALGRVARRHAMPRAICSNMLRRLRDGCAGSTRFRTLDDTLRYCYHVAGVVGLMMARSWACATRGDASGAPATSARLPADQHRPRHASTTRASAAATCRKTGWRGRHVAGGCGAAAAPPALHALAGELVELAEPYYASARTAWRSCPALRLGHRQRAADLSRHRLAGACPRRGCLGAARQRIGQAQAAAPVPGRIRRGPCDGAAARTGATHGLWTHPDL